MDCLNDSSVDGVRNVDRSAFEMSVLSFHRDQSIVLDPDLAFGEESV